MIFWTENTTFILYSPSPTVLRHHDSPRAWKINAGYWNLPPYSSKTHESKFFPRCSTSMDEITLEIGPQRSHHLSFTEFKLTRTSAGVVETTPEITLKTNKIHPHFRNKQQQQQQRTEIIQPIAKQKKRDHGKD
jgi:hypothetical protein